ncbi:MAG: ABC transporter permease [Micromonosporaceae bacterium]
MSGQLVAPRPGSVDGAAPPGPPKLRILVSRVVALCLVELQKIRRDRLELAIRAVQPLLWLGIFGATVGRLEGLPTGGLPYLDFILPGVLTQSSLFIAILYGIHVIWDRDAGVLAKLMVTPTPRVALVAGKAFAAGLRGLTNAAVVLLLAVVLGIGVIWNPLRLLGVGAVVLLGAAAFCCLSILIAGLVRTRERMMGIGQLIIVPLFFASNALYPVELMPPWLQAVSTVNPLTYQVDALRGLLLGSPATYLLDVAVLAGACAVMIVAAATLLPRLAR